eukprot:6200719-Pleurochrysis_carterae.AAC.1
MSEMSEWGNRSEAVETTHCRRTLLFEEGKENRAEEEGGVFAQHKQCVLVRNGGREHWHAGSGAKASSSNSIIGDKLAATPGLFDNMHKRNGCDATAFHEQLPTRCSQHKLAA